MSEIRVHINNVGGWTTVWHLAHVPMINVCFSIRIVRELLKMSSCNLFLQGVLVDVGQNVVS